MSECGQLCGRDVDDQPERSALVVAKAPDIICAWQEELNTRDQLPPRRSVASRLHAG